MEPGRGDVRVTKGVTGAVASWIRSMASPTWPELVGVDMSERSIKVVHLRRGRGRLIRVRGVERPLPGPEAGRGEAEQKC